MEYEFILQTFPKVYLVEIGDCVCLCMNNILVLFSY